MDFEKLKESVLNIRMPDEMKTRIIQNCQSVIQNEKENQNMNGNFQTADCRNIADKPVTCKGINTKYGTGRTNGHNTHARPRKLIWAAVIPLCLCLAAGAAAAGRSGFFSNIVRWWDGAVTGTRYEQASGEIQVSAHADGQQLTVIATFLTPEEFPYRGMELLGIHSYQIQNASGKRIAKEETSDLFPITDGKAEITLPLDRIPSGEYRLVITSFTGSSKGDQPLEIQGAWECGFTL